MELLGQRACTLQDWVNMAGVDIQRACIGKSVLEGYCHLVIAGICFDEPGPVPHWIVNSLNFIPEIAFQKDSINLYASL